MSTDRRRHDPFAPRRRQSTPEPEPAQPTEPASEAPQTDDPASLVPADLDDITLKDLRALAELADVPTYGTKAELAARIRAAK